MRRCVFFLLTLISINHAYNQENKATEIQRLLDSAIRYGPKNIESIFSISKRINELTGENKQLDSFKIHAHRIKGFAFLMQQEIDSATIELKKAINYFEKDSTLINQAPNLFTAIIFGISHHESNKGNYVEAYQTLINLRKKIDKKNTKSLASVNVSLANLNQSMGYNDEAEKLIKKTLKLKNIGELNTNLLYSYLGSIYLEQKLDSSHYFFSKSITFFKKNKNLHAIYYIKTGFATIHIKRGELKQAKRLLKEIENYQKKYAITSLGSTYLLLAEIANYENQLDKELKYLKLADLYLERDFYLPDKQILYERYASYYAKIKDFKQKFQFQLKANQIKDSINNKEQINLTKELEIKYETKLKEAELTKKLELINSQKKQKKLLISAIICISILLLLTFIFHKKRLLTQKELSEEKLKALSESQKVKAIQANLDGQNKERTRIAKDLHDSISGNLAAIKIKLTNIENYQSKEIKTIIKNVDATYREVRAISHNLLPESTSQQNFVSSIKQLITLYKTDLLKIDLDIYPEREVNNLSNTVLIEVYKILQELITNINKHAKASKGLINITLHEKYLNILVEDNGIGFQTNSKKNKYAGIGITNITSRVKSLNGVIEIDSIKGFGANININIPINYAKQNS